MDLKIGAAGELALPGDVRQRYGLVADAQIRLIETQNAILLVPLNNAPVTTALEKELAEWQALGETAWEMFPYEDDA